MIKETTTNPDPYRQEHETPFFSDNENFTKAIADAGIKAAEATHKFNMQEIKAKMLADLCNTIIANSPLSVNLRHPEFVSDYANQIVEQTLGKM